jgi:hypothetical protein
MDPSPLSWMNAKDTLRRCEAMMKVLWDADQVDGLFQKARAVIDDVSGGNLDRDAIRTEAITAAILKKLSK